MSVTAAGLMLSCIDQRPARQNDANDPSAAQPATEDAMTAKQRNGAASAPDTTPFMFAIMPNPALQTFAASQRVALEAARFWARRMHSYAEQMETLCECAGPDDVARAQSMFLERMREDYAEESKALRAILALPSANGADEAPRD